MILLKKKEEKVKHHHYHYHQLQHIPIYSGMLLLFSFFFY
jgi:hypothetical protein